MNIRYGLVAALVTAFAGAATTVSAESAEPNVTTDELIVVTGSRIARPSGTDTPTPTTVVDAEAIALSGNINVGDFLNDLPQFRSTFSLQNSTRFIGTAGLNLLDLRGLGDVRTLVLVDGRRHVGSSNGTTAVDINSIPSALIDRVDVITGGASAIYGADAVTGVVNFITKTNFEGLEVEGYGMQPSDDGGETYEAGVTWGMNFSDGRGNVALHYDRQDLNQIEGVDRQWIADEWGAVPNPNDTGTDDGIPDLVFKRNTRNNLIGANGVIWGEHPIEDVFGLPVDIWNAFVLPNSGVPGGPYTFTRDGQLVAFDPGQLFTDPDGFVGDTSIGGDGLAFAPSTQMIPDVTRDNFYGRAHFDVSDHLRVTGEAKYVRNKVKQYGQPTFDFFGGPFPDLPTIYVSTDNPFMPTDLVNVLEANGMDTVLINRFDEDLGFRGEDIERETQRYVLAVEGDLTDTWTYNTSFVYGRYDGDFEELNNRNHIKFANAVDAIAGPGGTPVCRDPAAQADGCVPLNLFGVGLSSRDAKRYIMEPDSTFDEKLEQYVFNAYAAGDLFQLPSGPIQGVIGMEVREEKSEVTYADIIKSGDTFFNALADSDGDYDVYEGFAEVSIPIFADAPWAKEFRIDAAERISDYSTIGQTETWKVGADWLPVDDVRFRVTRSKAVRAPNIAELFDPLGQNFFDVDDSCSQSQIDISVDPALRAANCAALGRPDDYESVTDSATIPGFSGGNEDLGEEEAKTWTWGVVLQPRWVPGLSITADYWSIEIESAISAVGEQDILDKCVDAASINNIYCPLVTRGADFEITSITQTSLNIARLESSGVDIELNYMWDIGETFDAALGQLFVNVIGSHVYKYETFDFEDEPDTQDDERGEIGNPIDSAVTNIRYERGPLTVNWRIEYLDSMRLIEDDAARERESPYRADELFYHDVQVRYLLEQMLGGDLTVYGGVSNLTEEDPPEYLTGVGEGSGIYDVFGRSFYVGAIYRMGGG